MCVLFVRGRILHIKISQYRGMTTQYNDDGLIIETSCSLVIVGIVYIHFLHPKNSDFDQTI